MPMLSRTHVLAKLNDDLLVVDCGKCGYPLIGPSNRPAMAEEAMRSGLERPASIVVTRFRRMSLCRRCTAKNKR